MPRRGRVGGRLSDLSPIGRELAGAIAELEPLGLVELLEALRAHDERLRAWADEPANHGRPTRDAPGHLRRVALGALLEHRAFGA